MWDIQRTNKILQILNLNSNSSLKSQSSTILSMHVTTPIITSSSALNELENRILGSRSKPRHISIGGVSLSTYNDNVPGFHIFLNLCHNNVKWPLWPYPWTHKWNPLACPLQPLYKEPLPKALSPLKMKINPSKKQQIEYLV